MEAAQEKFGRVLEAPRRGAGEYVDRCQGSVRPDWWLGVGVVCGILLLRVPIGSQMRFHLCFADRETESQKGGGTSTQKLVKRDMMPSPMHSGTPLPQSQKKPFSPSCFPCHSSLSAQLMLAVRVIVPSGSAFSFDGKIPLGVQKGPEPDLPLEQDTPVSPNSRKIKRLELHPGESQASPPHPEIPQPGWGRCRFAVRRVRAAVAAHARSRLARGRRALPAKGPGFQSPKTACAPHWRRPREVRGSSLWNSLTDR